MNGATFADIPSAKIVPKISDDADSFQQVNQAKKAKSAKFVMRKLS